MTIRKAVFSFTFLFDDTIDPEDSVKEMTVSEIFDECDVGHMMGRVLGGMTITAVPNESVAAEEIALGGDGTFFADPDELTHARLDAEEDDA